MSEVDISRIDVHELKRQIDANPDLCLIDVREEDEWNQVRIPSAIHIPKNLIAERIDAVTSDKQKPVYLHCRGGVRSLEAAHTLISLGYKQVYSVNGGIQEWIMFGYDVIE